MKYRTIVVDPPWPQKGGGSLMGREGFLGGPSIPLPYSTMSVQDILALPVRDLASRNCHLYLWTTNGFLRDAFGVLQAWGFTYSTTLVWAKNPMGGGLGGAFGISTEYVLFGYRGRVKARSKIRGTWFNWKRPYDERGKPKHSAKPPEFFEMVEQVSHRPRVELFAREARTGWACWGDQAPDPIDWDPGNEIHTQ